MTAGAEPSGRDALGDLIGIEHLEPGDASARARIAVSDRILQPYGLVHGGVYPVLAEAMCSKATNEAVQPEGKLAVGQSTNATFLRPISEGHVNAAAQRPPPRPHVVGVAGGDHRRRGPSLRAGPGRGGLREACERRAQPLNRLVIGSRRSRPNAFGVILIPGGACRRLYSARSTMRSTSSTTSSGSPAATMSSRPWSRST